MNENTLAILKSEVAKLEKTYGSGIVSRFSENDIAERAKNSPAISTGSVSLDMATGVGGIPLGRITEIYGEESSGKTSLSLKIIAETQKRGEIGAIIDSENALDLAWAQKMGVNLEDLLVSQPDYGEAAIDVAKALIGTGQVRTVVFDSVAAMQPKEVMEADTNKRDVAQLARMLSQEMNKLQALVSRHDVCCVFTNQIRDNLSFGAWGYVNPYTTPGGHALKFAASLRIECKCSSKNDQGRWTKAKCVKNKVGPPFLEGRFFITFQGGIDTAYELFEVAKDKKVLKAAGNTFRFSDETYDKQFGAVMGWQKAVERIKTDSVYKDAVVAALSKTGGSLVGSSGTESFEEE